MNANYNDKSLMVDLATYQVTGYSPGASILRRALWHIVKPLLFTNSLVPFYWIKCVVLRMFGARLGESVVIKPRVNIKHPWRLSIGDHSWIGEGVWIDNLVEVEIGSNVCISQEAYLLTGNHDYKSTTFSLIVKPIRIEDGAWMGARSIACPGVNVGRNAVLTVGSVLTQDAEANGIYAGNPAQKVRTRALRQPTP